MDDSVKSILDGTEYCTIATICDDGSPWNVPVRFAYDESKLYFRSPVGTRHGLNIARDSRVSVVIVDTKQLAKGAVYVHSHAYKVEAAIEQNAIDVFNKRFNNPPDQWPDTEYFEVAIGELDQDRSFAKMYYFKNRGAV